MTKSDAPMISQISKQHRDLVQKLCEERGANLSRDEFLHRTKEQWMTERDWSIKSSTRYLARLG